MPRSSVEDAIEERKKKFYSDMAPFEAAFKVVADQAAEKYTAEIAEVRKRYEDRIQPAKTAFDLGTKPIIDGFNLDNKDLLSMLRHKHGRVKVAKV